MARSYHKVTSIDAHTWCIEEKRLTQQCLMYLLEGKDAAMLIDTGYGFGNVGAVAAQLTRRPVFVVNTHAHLDHIGGNHFISDIYLHDAERDIFCMHTDPVEVVQMVDEQIPRLLAPLLKGFRRDIITQTISGEYHWFTCPKSFDLGGRNVDVIFTPGHTPGSICLLDRKNRVLFSGDTVCDWGVLLHLRGSLSPEAYRQSLEQLWSIREQFDTICPGHHGWPITVQRVEDYIHCADGILAQSISPTETGGYWEYRWKDIRITAPKGWNDHEKTGNES